MLESIFAKLHIKTKPDKFLTYLFYILTIGVCIICLVKIIRFIFGDLVIQDNISPYLYSIFFILPVLAFSYYVNSGIPKNDDQKIKMYVITLTLFCIILASLAATWINKIFWWAIPKIGNYETVMSVYPELFSPAIKAITFVFPFIGVFKLIDYILFVYRDEDMNKSIAGFVGLNTKSNAKDTGVYSCSTVICKNKGSSIPVVVPEKKRFEATLVQGATGTGKTATVLLPMSALDLEKKFFFRELSKKIGYSMLKKGIAYVVGPYNNEYINKNFTLNFLKPKRGMEEQFLLQVRNLIQYKDEATDEIVYKNLGITVVENDGKFISDFIGVAKKFDLEVLSVDPSNPENTLSINPFAIEDPNKVASIIADVLKSMYEDQGGGSPGDPFFTQVTLDAFQNLGILLKEMYPRLNNGEMASLEDMLELLYNFDRVEEMTEEMKKVPELEQKYRLLINYFEKNFYKPALNINGYEIPGTKGSGRKDTEKYLYGAITQLNNLVRNPGLKKALCGKTNILQFDKALENGSIITACSRKGDLGIIQSKAFGMFFILQFQDAVLRRKGSEDSRTPHFLYIDEFPEYLNKDMDVMFTLFRKYRCAVTIALQNLSQLEKSGKGYYRQTVLANTKTQIIFGDTVPEDSEYWEKAFGKEKVPDTTSSFGVEGGELRKTTRIDIKKKERAESFKIQDQGFGAVYYKTKNEAGKTIYGQGKTSFLASKYKQDQNILNFNFEKYMVTKPDSPTVIMNDSDADSDDDKLFGVNTTKKLMEELKNSDIKEDQNDNYIKISSTADKINNINQNVMFEDIVFDNLEPEKEDAKKDGGAITESYESPVINKKD